jgi:hypothetical protein
VAAAPGLSTLLRARWRRFDGPDRRAGVDLARGLAVIGMLAAHLLALPEVDAADPTTWSGLASGRSSILFATLAGVSIALVTGGTLPVRGAARARASGRLAVRAGVLWLLGLALVTTGVPVYVILPAYALLFLLSLPFLGWQAPWLFAAAAALGILMPLPQAVWDAMPFWSTPDGVSVSALFGLHYPAPVWLAFLLAGLGVGRLDLRSVRTAAGIAASGTVLAVIGYGLDAVSGADEVVERTTLLGAVWTARPHSSGLLEVIGSGGFALAVIGVCLLACRTFLRWPAVPLRAVGSMPLTAYTAQLTIWAAVAAAVLGTTTDLRGFRDLEPFWPLTAGLVAGCTLWALCIGRGPLEALTAWLVRRVVPEPGARERVDRLDA